MKRIMKPLAIVFLVMSFAAARAQTLEDGLKALDYENYATAKRIFKALISQQPSEPKNYYYYGLALVALGQNDSAKIIFEKGIQADPKSIYNYVGMGRYYLNANKPQDALQQFDKARDLVGSKDITQYILIGDAYANSYNPNPQEAVNLLNKAIEINNKNADVYFVLGNAYEDLNKGGEAVSAYERAGELNPSMAKAYSQVGVIWRLARNYNQSLTSFQKAISVDPKFPPAYRELAELYYYTGQYEKAKTTYQQYLGMADKDDYTKYRYAQFLFLSKDYENALKEMNDLRKRLDYPIIWRLSAYSDYEVGNYAAGLTQMDTFFKKTAPEKIIPSDYEYYGKLLSKTGNDSLAMTYYQKAIDLDSTKFAYYADMGNILFAQKKYPEAASAYQKKVMASAKDATLQDYFNVGKSYYFAKDFVQADSAFEQMTELNKTWPISYFWRARVMTNLDNPDSIKGLAAPFYQLVIGKVGADTMKYKKELMEAYKYLGDINTFQEHYGVALYYYAKYLSLDPANEDVAKHVKDIKEVYKNTNTEVVPLQKHDHGLYIIPATINNQSVQLIFDDTAPNFQATEQTAGQFFGSSESGKIITVDKIIISNRTVKNPSVMIASNLVAPFVVGPGPLNQFNIVFDFQTGSLILL